MAWCVTPIGTLRPTLCCKCPFFARRRHCGLQFTEVPSPAIQGIRKRSFLTRTFDAWPLSFRALLAVVRESVKYLVTIGFVNVVQCPQHGPSRPAFPQAHTQKLETVNWLMQNEPFFRQDTTVLACMLHSGPCVAAHGCKRCSRHCHYWVVLSSTLRGSLQAVFLHCVGPR